MRFVYLATPYSKFPTGPDGAANAAAYQVAILLKAGIKVFSPITHTHIVSVRANIDVSSANTFWEEADAPFVELASAMVFCKLPSWEVSSGMARERAAFVAANKPVFEMRPSIVPAPLLWWWAGVTPGKSP